MWLPPYSCLNTKSSRDELSLYIRSIITEAENTERKDLLLRSIVLIILLCRSSKQEDRRLVSRFLDAYRKLGGTLIAEDPGTVWDISKFLEGLTGIFGDGLNSQFLKLSGSLESQQTTWFSSRLIRITNLVKSSKVQLETLNLTLDSKLSKSNISLTLPELGERIDMLLSILDLIQIISSEIKLILSSFSEYDKPMTASSIIAIGEGLCEISRVLEFMSSRMIRINYCLERGIQHSQFLILNLIQGIKKGILSDKKYLETKFDILCFLILAEKSFSGPSNQQRLNLARLSMELSASGRKVFKDSEWKSYTTMVEKLMRLTWFWDSLETISFIPYLSCQTELLGVMLEEVYTSRAPEKIKLLCHMWNLSAGVWRRSRFVETKDWISKFKIKIEDILEERIIGKVCSEVETQLRLIVHDRAGVQVDQRNPFKTLPSSVLCFLNLVPVPVLDTELCIRSRVEDYLSRVFYNLTTVSLYNWKTYGEMRHLAGTRMNLKTVQDHLPSQTLEQGLDVLQVMRNIGAFTVDYSYNMNAQIFLENKSSSKHLNTIHLR